MLDPDQGHAVRLDGRQRADQIVNLGLGEAAGDLVEEKHPGLRPTTPRRAPTARLTSSMTTIPPKRVVTASSSAMAAPMSY